MRAVNRNPALVTGILEDGLTRQKYRRQYYLKNRERNQEREKRNRKKKAENRRNHRRRICLMHGYSEEFVEFVIIHHIDRNRANNELWNLFPLSISEHFKVTFRHNDPFTDALDRAIFYATTEALTLPFAREMNQET